MRNKSITLAILTWALLFNISCKRNLAAINTNPNAPQLPQPDYLLTAAQKIGADLYWGVDNNFNASLILVQHWAKIQYTEPDRYIFSNNSFSTLWNTSYAQTLTNLNTIISQPTPKFNQNYKAVATILRCWVFQLLTDAYGNIPYQESGKIKMTLTPVYDDQKSVYLGLLSELDQATQSLDPAAGAILGDVMYQGKIDLWKKFGQSLRFRVALRIADREPELAKQVITSIFAHSDGLIDQQTETAQVKYTKPPYQNPVAAWFAIRDDYRIAKTMVDKLYELNDPRLAVYADMPADTTVHTYVGIPTGLPSSVASSLGFAKTSKPNRQYFASDENPVVILSFAEVLFYKAEAMARGFILGNPEEWYRKAIVASFQQFNITQPEKINAYLAQTSVRYQPQNFRKSIGEQKWIALFGQGLEAFAEWRRLDYPQLIPGTASVLEGKMPRRFIYPGTEQSLNGRHYKEAISRQGSDHLLTQLWFDVQ